MKKIILSSIALIGLIGCNIDRAPYDGGITDQVVTSETGLKQLLNGIYAKVRGGDVINQKGSDYGISMNYYRNGTYGADEVNLSGTTTDPLMGYYSLVRDASNARMVVAWNDGFSAINAINSIFKNLNEGRSEALDHMLGEAYYLRAFINFNMLLHYSKPYNQGRGNLGIPLKYTTDESDRPNRATVGESYDAVVKDLLSAERLMTGDSKNNIKATQAAAQALLARVYLYMDNNPKALEYADKVINSGKYSLVSAAELPTYAQKVPENNSETIFAVRYDTSSTYIYNPDYMLGSMYTVINNEGWGEMYAADPYIQLLQRFPQDVRNKFIQQDYKLDAQTKKKAPVVYWTEYVASRFRYEYKFYPANLDASGNYISFIKDGNTYPISSEDVNYGGPTYTKYFTTINGQKQYLTRDYEMNNRGGFPKYYINKLSLQEGYSQLYSPVISRLAELYLIRAEVKAKSGDVTGALNDVNVIRRRANAPEFASLPTGKTALDIVLDERWLEFAFESQRKFDLIRNNRAIDRKFPGVHLNETRMKLGKETIQPTDNDLQCDIPQSQINLQPGLQQNPL
ncbi:RagB/SusD family nutrient uptake outer membrane protein [Elizabethkingia bruuniana]|uniref:RagB/SusD family nutrient uptake outer membrane protein n=1 Tax=Elizabethkingia bruuniana TaxID=1756149 RepID=UPI00241F8C80|nr:RagB/SusD family nutrient uptake outer membrane protein [Elizabethkingia bruuniana]